MADEFDDKIAEIIDKPKTITSESGLVTQISVGDLIKADQHAANKKAGETQTAAMGMRLGRFNGPRHYGT